MKPLRLLAAVVLCLAVFAATSSMARADDFAVGRVIQLIHFEDQGYFVKLQTTTDQIDVQVAEDLFSLLEVGDTFVLRGETWSLLHKGVSEPSVGMGDNRR